MRQTAARSRVCEWQTVTVAFFCISSSAAGLPTMFERPTTTACLPSRSTPAASIMRRQPAGVQGAKQGSPLSSRPAFDRREAVDVLFRRDGLDDGGRVDMARQRQLHQNAVHGAVRRQRPQAGEQLGLGRPGRQGG